MLHSALLILSLVYVLAAEDCFDKLKWVAINGTVYVNDQPFVLKGINYDGFQTNSFSPDGLDVTSLNDILDFVQKNDFNAIRIPLSMEMLRDNPRASNINCTKNDGLCGSSATRLLDVLIHRAAERGLLVVLSNEQFAASAEILTTQFSLWYDAEYSEETVIRIWKVLINRYRHQWNVFAVDLKNEPYHYATWGDSNRTTDWNKAAERMIRRMYSFPGLFFVDGTAWGAEMTAAGKYPINTGSQELNNRVVYTPQCYGPSKYYRYAFKETPFPEVMGAYYMKEYGYLVAKGYAVIIGQWGARNSGSGNAWTAWYSEWMRTNCFTNNFYWSISFNAGIIEGLLLEDWKTPNQGRLDLLKHIQPNPTKFKAQNGQICITKGTFEPHCQRD